MRKSFFESRHQALQHPHIPLLVARIIVRRLRNERTIRKPRIVQQPPKRLNADISLPDVFVPVELRSARRLGIVAVPHPHCIHAKRNISLRDRVRIAFSRNNVVSGNMRMAGIEAHAHRRVRLQPLHQFRHLLKVAAQRALRTGRVFNQDAEIRSLPRQSVHRRSQSTLPQASAPHSASCPSTTPDAAPGIPRPASAPAQSPRESGNTLLADIRRLAANIHQVAGMDDQRPNIVLRPQRPHPLGLRQDPPSAPATSADSTKKSEACSRQSLSRLLDGIGGATRRPQVHSDSLAHFPILMADKSCPCAAVPQDRGPHEQVFVRGAEISIPRPGFEILLMHDFGCPIQAALFAAWVGKQRLARSAVLNSLAPLTREAR